MSWLIVTPAHNEERRLPEAARTLARQSVSIGLWVIVDDGSSDGTHALAESLDMPFPVLVMSTDNAGGLIGGSAFLAWQAGVDCGLKCVPDCEWIMKLDADVVLSDNYLSLIDDVALTHDSLGLAGGVLESHWQREQAWHVPGPVKAYTRAGYDSLREVPRAVGFDVVDEMAILEAGLKVHVDRNARFRILRPIGASQGRVHGRYRNGVVCRWTGYWAPYFFLHALRYCFRRPFVVGGVAVALGYLRAGDGPYGPSLRIRHRREQERKMRSFLRNPVSWLKTTYGY